MSESEPSAPRLSTFNVIVKEDLAPHTIHASFYRVNEDDTGGLDFYVVRDDEDECVATYAGGKWRRVMLVKPGDP